MKNTLQLFFLLTVMNLLITSTGLSGQGDSTEVNHRDSLSLMMKQAQKIQKEYEKLQQEKLQREQEEENMYGQQTGMFGVKLDVIFGYTATNSTYETASSFGGVQTNAKNGGFIGANVTLTLMGFSFTTGLSYSSKGFKTPYGNTFDMNYINLPLMMSFNFNIGKKVLIEPSVGPYIGFSLSGARGDSSSFKNIDIGITGSMQGTYMFQKHLGAMLGFKYEHGGLNNLSGSSSAEIKTRSWCLYSGIRFVF